MIARSGFYVPGDTWLHRLDPRVKLWFALLAVTLCLITPNLAVLAGVLIFTQAALLAGGIGLRRLGAIWLGLGPLIAVILFLQPFLMPGAGAPIWQLGPLRLTESGLLISARYALRVAAAAFAVALPIPSTPVSVLVRGMQKVGLPYRWGMMIGLALRYLATLGDLYTTISEAQQARGWDPSQGGLVRRVRATMPTLIALIVASLRLGDALALGLAARGFGGRSGLRRTALYEMALHPVDRLALAALTAAFVVVLLLSIR